MIAYLMLHGSTPAPDALRRCEELVENVPSDRAAQAGIQSAMAILHAMQGEVETARSLYRGSYAVLTELGAGIVTITSSIDSSQVERLAGDLAEAERELRRDFDALSAIGESYFRSTIAGLHSRARLLLGDVDGAAASAELTRALADPDDNEAQILWRQAEASVLVERGMGDEAVRLAREAVELTEGTVDLVLRADALVDLATILGRIGRGDESGPPLREALDLYERKGATVAVARTRRSLEGLAVTP